MRLALSNSRGALLLPVLLAFFIPTLPLAAQSRTNSPVFRSYKPPEELPLLLQRDPAHQSWQAFVAMRKANAGDPVAQQELALRYFTGTGVMADTVQAALWMRRAADQNLKEARFNLALFAYHGWGIPWNPFESYRQFLVCAEQDMPEAQYAVGIFCIENLIMPENWERGYAWVQRAAEGGYAPAREILPSFAQQLSLHRSDTLTAFPDFGGMTPIQPDTPAVGGGLAELRQALSRADPDTRKALGFARLAEGEINADSLDLDAISRAADEGSPEALALLGRCAQDGVALPRDRVLAASYFLRAVRMESQRAGRLLWGMGQEKDFVPEVRSRADRGDPMAQYVWAGLLSFGLDVPLIQAKAYLTGEQAVALLRKSIGGGYVPARIELGLWYYSGRWVVQDERRALELWKEAAEAGNREALLRLAVVKVRSGKAGREELEILHSASESGAMLADVALGYCYESGILVTRSAGEAANLYRLAWRRGSQDAYRALRRLHDALRPPDAEFAIGE